MALTFTLNGQPLDGTPDAYGVQWFASVTGWDGPPVTPTLTNRPADHGAYRGPSYFNARELTVSGIAICPNVAEVRRAKDRLDVLVPIGVDVPLTSVDDRTVTAQLSAELLKVAETEQTLRFSIPLQAASPFKYGAQQQVTIPMVSGSAGVGSVWLFPLHLYVANSITAVNDGTQAARPVVTYWGPCDSPWSTNSATGETAAYGIDLPTASDFLVVDHDVGSVLLGGSTPRRSTQMPYSHLWSLPPGESTLTAGAVSVGTGAYVSVTFAPTYL